MKRYDTYYPDSMEVMRSTDLGDWVRHDDPDIAAGQLAIERMRALATVRIWPQNGKYTCWPKGNGSLLSARELESLADEIIEAERAAE